MKHWDPRNLDPKWPFDLTATDFVLDPKLTALLVIDMQAEQTAAFKDGPLAQRYPDIMSYWTQRVDDTVVPNTRRLIDWFRMHECKIVYTRNGQVTGTGDEMTRRLRPRSRGTGPGTGRSRPGYQVDQRLAPRDEDLVVDKLTSGGFTASLLDHALRNMGIRSLVITGVLTDACVFGTARGASELGYDSLICEDACATYTQQAHDDALLMHARIFGRVGTTDEVVSELSSEVSE